MNMAHMAWAMLPAVMDGIETTRSGARGQNSPAFRRYGNIPTLESLALAAIAMKVTLTKHSVVNQECLVNVTTSIGRAVQDECQMRHYEREAPGLLSYLKKHAGTIQWHTSKAGNTHGHEQADIPKWDTWAQGNNIKIGTWLLEQVMAKTGWFTIELKRTGKKTDQYVVHTDDFLRVRDTIMHDAIIQPA